MNRFIPVELTSRESAMTALQSFLPRACAYHAKRNFVVPGHENVSRLSPALRLRLITEYEVLGQLWEQYDFGQAETFEKEVWWRIYWKGWLEKRPALWEQYRSELKTLEWSDRCNQISSGNSGVAIMDHFTRELIETGYLHNHARMWWAAWWVHAERLPWQLGADFFLRHLFDGDAASNTLSWRWVAGIHTRGKEYLARRANLERYIAAEILDSCPAGWECFENPLAVDLPFSDPPDPLDLSASDSAALESVAESTRYGVWLHDEDLHLESSPLSRLRPQKLRVFLPKAIWESEGYSVSKQTYLEAALKDGLERASLHFSCAGDLVVAQELGVSLLEWAKSESLDTIITMRPFTGVLREQLDVIAARLEKEGIALKSFRRSNDSEAMNFATAGFFSFWKKTSRLREELHRERNLDAASS